MNLLGKSTVLVAGQTAIAQDFYQYLVQDQLEVHFIDELRAPTYTYDLIFIFTADDLERKSVWINQLKDYLSESGILCINIDGIDLHKIQEHSCKRVVGANFCYPMTASPFMEIVTTKDNKPKDVHALEKWAISILNKDPYIVKDGISVRAYMQAAMAREAFYLVDKGYASILSIDRACRNDAGYYLPFTGNYLYMDLMGTVAYAMVMMELNRELSNANQVPDWFASKVQNSEIGMKVVSGLYTYNEGDYEKWNNIVREFSVEINKLIIKYKKDYVEG